MTNVQLTPEQEWEIVRRILNWAHEESDIKFDVDAANDPDDIERPFLLIDSWDTADKLKELFPEGEGISGGFTDEYAKCDHCYRAVHLLPDTAWTKGASHFRCDDGDLLCGKCIPEFADEYLESMANNEKNVVNTYFVDPAEHGWVKVDVEFHAGMREHQTWTHPKKVLEALVGMDVIFTGDFSPFDADYFAWVREGNAKEARERLMRLAHGR